MVPNIFWLSETNVPRTFSIKDSNSARCRVWCGGMDLRLSQKIPCHKFAWNVRKNSHMATLGVKSVCSRSVDGSPRKLQGTIVPGTFGKHRRRAMLSGFAHIAVNDFCGPPRQVKAHLCLEFRKKCPIGTFEVGALYSITHVYFSGTSHKHTKRNVPGIPEFFKCRTMYGSVIRFLM